MALERTHTRSGAAEPPDSAPSSGDPDGSGTSDLAAELHAALDGDLAREVRFWRARAEALGAQMERLQGRLLALTEHLPARYARLLTCDPAALSRDNDWPDPLAGWQETVLLEPASVASELPRLWERLHPLAPR